MIPKHENTNTHQESIWDGLRRTDVKAIDDGLHGLSSSVEVNIGLMSFSDAEDDDDDDDDEESTNSGTLFPVAHKLVPVQVRNASTMTSRVENNGTTVPPTV